MGKLGSIFSILAALTAVAAAVLSFMISGRRAEFKGRADKLATGVATMAMRMDEKSGTNLATSATFTPANKEAGTPETGTLGFQAFHNAKDDSGAYAAFQQTVDKVVKQATDLTQQRNELSEALASVAIQLQFPETDLDVADLTNLADTERSVKAIGAVLSHATVVSNRDRALIDAVTKAATDIEHPIDRQVFLQRESTTDADGNTGLGDFACRTVLTEFNINVSAVKGRCDEYVQAITDGISRVTKHEWEADPEKLKDEQEYGSTLTSLLNDFDDINEKLALYDKAKIELAEQKQKIADLEDDLEDMRRESEKTQDELAKAKQELNRIKQETPSMAGGVQVGPDGIDPNLEGEVLSVNEEWNYIIIGLGNRQIRENMDMLVARDDKLIAKVHISKVHSKVSIAEILPQVTIGSVKVGDRVILSSVTAN